MSIDPQHLEDGLVVLDIAAADEATAPYGDGCPGPAVGDVRTATVR
jgi:hypothetical protein